MLNVLIVILAVRFFYSASINMSVSGTLHEYGDREAYRLLLGESGHQERRKKVIGHM